VLQEKLDRVQKMHQKLEIDYSEKDEENASLKKNKLKNYNNN